MEWNAEQQSGARDSGVEHGVMEWNAGGWGESGRAAADKGSRWRGDVVWIADVGCPVEWARGAAAPRQNSPAVRSRFDAAGDACRRRVTQSLGWICGLARRRPMKRSFGGREFFDLVVRRWSRFLPLLLPLWDPSNCVMARSLPVNLSRQNQRR